MHSMPGFLAEHFKLNIIGGAFMDVHSRPCIYGTEGRAFLAWHSTLGILPRAFKI